MVYLGIEILISSVPRPVADPKRTRFYYLFNFFYSKETQFEREREREQLLMETDIKKRNPPL